MRFVVISDTHNLHRHYGRAPFNQLPDGDVLIHCGDVTTHGTVEELEIFLSWFRSQSHGIKIWVAGNHDRCLEGVDVRQRWNVPNVIYLEQSGVVIGGLRVWGSPYTPDHCDFAFQLGNRATDYWEQIPLGTDVLITHGPPHGIQDQGHGEDHAGCPKLLKEVTGRVHPKYHLFGHLHESFGRCERDGTVFVNAAVHTWLWKQDRRRDPVVVELKSAEDGH